MKPFVYESSLQKGMVAVAIETGTQHTTRLNFTPDEALAFAADLTDAANRMPRHREGTAADLGCEVLP